MIYQKKKQKTKLSPEDSVRMARLYEEISGRLQEMSMIAGRIHGQVASWTRAEASLGATPNADSGNSDTTMNGIEIKQNCSGDDEGCCVIYDHDEGTCTPC